MICPKCNHKLPDDSEFCQYCGGKISDMAANIMEGVATAISGRKNLDNMPENTSSVQMSISPENERSNSPDAIYRIAYDPTVAHVKTAPIHNPPNEAPVQRKEKSVKMKFCSRCGAIIDNNTKVCTGCGKQYFKGITKSPIPIIILSILVIVISVVSVTLLYENQELTSINVDQALTISTKEGIIKRQKNDIIDLEDKLLEYEDLARFIDNHVVFIEDDGTNLYHKYECSKCTGDYFGVYNTEKAEQLGYYPCDECH